MLLYLPVVVVFWEYQNRWLQFLMIINCGILKFVPTTQMPQQYMTQLGTTIRLPIRIALSKSRRSRSEKSRHDIHYLSDPQSVKNDYSYCVNLVKERDGEGYRRSNAI
jgi:hypothetical protein